MRPLDREARRLHRPCTICHHPDTSSLRLGCICTPCAAAIVEDDRDWIEARRNRRPLRTKTEA